MSYPNDLPAVSMSNIWNSGAYTPEDIVVYIRNNHTPINKTSMRNSVGYQISLLQNFVNGHYLGRSTAPVHTGYIDTVVSTGVYAEGIYSKVGSTGTTIDVNGATVDKLYGANLDRAEYTASGIFITSEYGEPFTIGKFYALPLNISGEPINLYNNGAAGYISVSQGDIIFTNGTDKMRIDADSYSNKILKCSGTLQIGAGDFGLGPYTQISRTNPTITMLDAGTQTVISLTQISLTNSVLLNSDGIKTKDQNDTTYDQAIKWKVIQDSVAGSKGDVSGIWDATYVLSPTPTVAASNIIGINAVLYRSDGGGDYAYSIGSYDDPGALPTSGSYVYINTLGASTSINFKSVPETLAPAGSISFGICLLYKES